MTLSGDLRCLFPSCIVSNRKLKQEKTIGNRTRLYSNPYFMCVCFCYEISNTKISLKLVKLSNKLYTRLIFILLMLFLLLLLLVVFPPSCFCLRTRFIFQMKIATRVNSHWSVKKV